MSGVKSWLATGAPFAFEKLTVSNTAKVLTAATYNPAGQRAALFAVVTVETQAVRYRVDGTDPDASTGHLANAALTTGQADSRIELHSAKEIQTFRAIRAAGIDSVIQVTYYR